FVMEDSGWSFLTDTVALTLSPDGSGASCIAGDAGRYRLPNTIRSAPVGDWTLSFATGQVWKVRSTSPALVAERRAASAGASAPVVAAVRSLANPDDANGGAAWEVIIAPTPDMAYTMQATFRQHTEWSELDARHIAGGEHDYTLTRLAVWEYKRRDVLPLAERAGLAKEAEQLVAKSRALDMGRRPTLLGTAPQTAATYDDFPGNVQERTAGSFIPPTGV
ncbi:MAG TPA: hypothetical protein VFF65_12870, partial [Phycisphaerales bacterium]|nr:hypothetical protein [Phycisphaerales bacterium]